MTDVIEKLVTLGSGVIVDFKQSSAQGGFMVMTMTQGESVIESELTQSEWNEILRKAFAVAAMVRA